jgi:hypothetical protein
MFSSTTDLMAVVLSAAVFASLMLLLVHAVEFAEEREEARERFLVACQLAEGARSAALRGFEDMEAWVREKTAWLEPRGLKFALEFRDISGGVLRGWGAQAPQPGGVGIQAPVAVKVGFRLPQAGELRVVVW